MRTLLPFTLILLLPIASSLALPTTMTSHPEDILQTESPRLNVCDPSPMHVTILAARAQDGPLISSLLWSAGIPPGSSVRIVTGIEAPKDAIVAPNPPTASWARYVVC